MTAGSWDAAVPDEALAVEAALPRPSQQPSSTQLGEIRWCSSRGLCLRVASWELAAGGVGSFDLIKP